MKFVAALPPKENYILLEKRKTYIFTDRDTRALQISSPTDSPWGKQWKIVPSMQMQKSDGSKWPYRLTLRLFPLDGEGELATLEREKVKGVFAWTHSHTAAFYAFPITDKLSIFYSFYQRSLEQDKPKQNKPIVTVPARHQQPSKGEEKKSRPALKGEGNEATNEGRTNEERIEESMNAVADAVTALKRQHPDWDSLGVRRKIALLKEKTKEQRGTAISSQTLYREWCRDLW